MSGPHIVKARAYYYRGQIFETREEAVEAKLAEAIREAFKTETAREDVPSFEAVAKFIFQNILSLSQIVNEEPEVVK